MFSDPWIASLVYVIILLPIAMIPHEYGHYYVAVKRGIKVKSFNIGLPMPVLIWRRKDTRQNLKWLPVGIHWWMWRWKTSENFSIGFSPYFLGAYVHPDEESFNKASLTSKVLTLMGGPIANLITATVLFCIYVWMKPVAIVDGSLLDYLRAYFLLYVALPVGALIGGFFTMLGAWVPPVGLFFLYQLFSGLDWDTTANSLGPVGSVNTMSNGLMVGIQSPSELIFTAAFFCFGIGIFNSVGAIPIVDGGRIWLVLIGKKLSFWRHWKIVETRILLGTFLLMMAMVIYGVWRDLQNFAVPTLIFVFGPTLLYHLSGAAKRIVSRKEIKNTALAMA